MCIMLAKYIPRVFTPHDEKAPLTVMLPFSSLNLVDVAHLMPLLTACTLPVVSTDTVTIGDQHSSVLCKLQTVRRAGPRLDYSVEVTVAGEIVYTATLAATGNSVETLVGVCGVVFRRATLVWSSARLPVCSLTDGPQHVITGQWSPAQVVACACTLYMQTFNARYMSVTVAQRKLYSLVATFESAGRPRNVHFEYKPTGVGVVMLHESARAAYSLVFANGLNITFPSETTFLWHQPNALCLPQHTQAVWRLLVTIL